MTRYVVLQGTGPESERGWVEQAHVEAVSAEAAVRKAVTDKGGTFIAVPMRSWSPITVEVEMTRSLKVTAA